MTEGLWPFPRYIWLYWAQGLSNAPDLVQRCYQSWQIANPGWDVVMLDDAEAEHFISWESLNVPSSLQARSDVLRLALLARHGGVWADASCFCVRPLDEWLPEYMASGFFAFSNPGPDRMLSSWFLASEPRGPAISSWASAAQWYWGDGAPTRKMPSVRLSVAATRAAPTLWFTPAVRSWLGVYPYHWLHYLFRRIYDHNPAVRTVWDATPKFSADIPHAALRKGLASPVDNEFRRAVDERQAPLYKLNWRRGDAAGPDSVLWHLYGFRTPTGIVEPLGSSGPFHGLGASDVSPSSHGIPRPQLGDLDHQSSPDKLRDAPTVAASVARGRYSRRRLGKSSIDGRSGLASVPLASKPGG
jgi:Capsular polysaccharide synthesis protein